MDILTDGGELIQKRDYTLLLDRSEKMAELDSASGLTLQAMLQDATLAVVTQCERFDFDGISLYFYGSTFQQFEGITSTEVAKLFRNYPPLGTSYLARPLQDAIDRYFNRRRLGFVKPNGETIFVLTGSVPEDIAEVKGVIIEASKRIDRDEELAISIVQVGGDLALRSILLGLDDDLQKMGAKFDICDTVTFEQIDRAVLSEVLLSAIVD
ncbi:MAG: hypothetical protein J7641_07160 [Cyanobacteria bacterium SID2]|nr:hypothetical protein [Cyanobacteria bacterium SID2]MBP0005555.1 hypothetical protein [Cyanobacteria bacterium SBC]